MKPRARPSSADPEALVAAVLEEETRRHVLQRKRERAEQDGSTGVLPGVGGEVTPVPLRAMVAGAGGAVAVLCALPFVEALWSSGVAVVAPDIGKALDIGL